jgi:hypothetical protein
MPADADSILSCSRAFSTPTLALGPHSEPIWQTYQATLTPSVLLTFFWGYIRPYETLPASRWWFLGPSGSQDGAATLSRALDRLEYAGCILELHLAKEDGVPAL